MVGSKFKCWMETQVAKVRVSKAKPWRVREDGTGSSGVPSSSSNDTSILLGGGSSMGSFTHNLSSPDTGYSTDGYSPKSQHPPFPAQINAVPVSKTSILTQSRAQRPENAQNQILASFISSSGLRPAQESPRKPPRLSKIKQQLEQQQQQEITNTAEVKVECDISKIRTSVVSSSGDSGQGTLGSNRHSGESFGHLRFPNINEEPRETEILSDWAPTDEDVDEGVLTPTPTPPPCPRSPCTGIPDASVIQTSELPKAYDTLQLLNQCNHVFPLPSCTGPRCLQAQSESRAGNSRKRGKSSGPFGFFKKLFKRKSSVERDLPENSRGKPIRTGPGTYWLTPTPNSFRKRTLDAGNYCSTTIPKGVKSDIIRLPQTTPTTLPTSTSTPTHIAPRESPFLSRLNSTAASPASIRFKPQQIVTPIHQSPRPMLAFAASEDMVPPRLPPPNIPTTNRIQPPSYNNYSPIHRLVVTTGVHPFHHHHRPAPESPLVRALHTRPPPPPPPRQAITPILVPKGLDHGSSRYQYIPSSNQNSPNLNHVVPRRVSLPTVTFEAKHYYASPLTQNSCHAQRLQPSVSAVPPVQYQPHQGFEIDRIYEKVEGTEVSDEGDGEGGVYEIDDVSWGDSELSVSQGQESNRSRQSQSSAQASQSALPRSVQMEPPAPRFPPTSWNFTKTELKLLEKEADLKYQKLLWEAELLLRQFTIDDNRKQNIPRQRVQHVQHPERREAFRECSPASDPLRRKTYDCWALRRLQQELALASPPVLHRSRHNLQPSNPHNPKLNHHHHPVI